MPLWQNVVREDMVPTDDQRVGAIAKNSPLDHSLVRGARSGNTAWLPNLQARPG
jgi:hypothetical protein